MISRKNGRVKILPAKISGWLSHALLSNKQGWWKERNGSETIRLTFPKKLVRHTVIINYQKVVGRFLPGLNYQNTPLLLN